MFTVNAFFFINLYLNYQIPLENQQENAYLSSPLRVAQSCDLNINLISLNN